MVAHLSTNRARRRLTSLIEANALITTPDHQTPGWLRKTCKNTRRKANQHITRTIRYMAPPSQPILRNCWGLNSHFVPTWMSTAKLVSSWTDGWFHEKHAWCKPATGAARLRLVRAVVLFCAQSYLVCDADVASNFTARVKRLCVENYRTESAAWQLPVDKVFLHVRFAFQTCRTSNANEQILAWRIMTIPQCCPRGLSPTTKTARRKK